MKEKNMHVFEVIYIKKIGGPQYVQCSNKYYIHNTGIERVGTVHSTVYLAIPMCVLLQYPQVYRHCQKNSWILNQNSSYTLFCNYSNAEFSEHSYLKLWDKKAEKLS